MLNSFYNYILSIMPEIVSGIISGLFATAIFWCFINKILRPNIKISKDIALIYEESKDGDKIPVYRIKVCNESLRAVYDIRTTVRLRYRSRYATIDLPVIPVLQKKGKKVESSDYQRELPFRLSYIRESKISGFSDKELNLKYQKQTLSFNDFILPKTKIEMVLMAKDSNNNMIVVIQSYKYNEILSSIKEGKFEKNTLKVLTSEDDGVTE